MANDFPALPFEIGSTYGATATTDGAQWEGREFTVEDRDYSSSNTSAKPNRAYGANGWRTLRVVRNVSGVALLPGLLVSFKSGAYGKQVDGYARTTDQGPVFPVDEFLPAAGVPNNDLFYICVNGPASIKVAVDATGANIAQGAEILATTAAASTVSTTAGRIYGAAVIGAATTFPANNVFNRIGLMLSSATTADAGASKLCYIYPKYI